RPTLIALALAALAGLTSIFSGASALRSRVELEALLARADAIETARPAKAVPVARPPDNSGLARDIAALRAEVASLSRATDPAPTDPGAKSAQDAKAQKAWTERMVRAISETLEARLALSPEQKIQVADVMTAQYVALSEVQRAGASAKETKGEIARVMSETTEKIRDVLTVDQKAAFTPLVKTPAGVFGIDLIPNAGYLPGEEGSSGH
ncbi:MAG: hypothetical protein K8T20_11070, partial [Planctomycetes bacterium]|nr:hypothetical protein [Planctomycetota bacterium]